MSLNTVEFENVFLGLHYQQQPQIEGKYHNSIINKQCYSNPCIKDKNYRTNRKLQQSYEDETKKVFSDLKIQNSSAYQRQNSFTPNKYAILQEQNQIQGKIPQMPISFINSSLFNKKISLYLYLKQQQKIQETELAKRQSQQNVKLLSKNIELKKDQETLVSQLLESYGNKFKDQMERNKIRNNKYLELRENNKKQNYIRHQSFASLFKPKIKQGLVNGIIKKTKEEQTNKRRIAKSAQNISMQRNDQDLMNESFNNQNFRQSNSQSQRKNVQTYCQYIDIIQKRNQLKHLSQRSQSEERNLEVQKIPIQWNVKQNYEELLRKI